MRLSRSYIPTAKDISADIVAVSHRYSLKAGLVAQVASGIYTWLPLGLVVLRKVEKIVREEMQEAGFTELLMPSMQPADLWKESGRYTSYGSELFKVTDRNGREMILGPTHEEVITDLVKMSLKSSRELPINLYQLQWKFRDEPRPKNGILRCREFLMMDAYSFDTDKDSSLRTYSKVFEAYTRIFRRIGLTPMAVSADPGAIGGNLSHEFHIITPTGESTLYFDPRALELAQSPGYSVDTLNDIYAAADDAHNPQNCGIPPHKIQVERGIEVGHIFYLDDRYSRAMNLEYVNTDGKSSTCVKMGCYGIGISRLVAAIIEVFYSKSGMKWPLSVAPFKIGVVNLFPKNSECLRVANHVHDSLASDSLYDDTSDSPGVKLSRMDLLGPPWQVIIGNSFIKDEMLELRNRIDGTIGVMSVENVITRLRV